MAAKVFRDACRKNELLRGDMRSLILRDDHNSDSPSVCFEE